MILRHSPYLHHIPFYVANFVGTLKGINFSTSFRCPCRDYLITSKIWVVFSMLPPTYGMGNKEEINKTRKNDKP
jgi:hypothetical protein